MSRVLARGEGEWILATVEGPRTVRAALRQAVANSHLRYDANLQEWAVHRESWSSAVLVFSRFELPIVWTGTTHGGLETRTSRTREEPLMTDEPSQAFSISLRSAGLTIERTVDSETAWAILALVLAKENTRPMLAAS